VKICLIFFWIFRELQAHCKAIGAGSPSDIRSKVQKVHGRRLLALIQQSLLD
jgi:hypothetical protein